MDFLVLGPLQVRRGASSVELGPRRQRALLALLAANVGRVVTTDRILEELWGDEAFGKEQALWVYVSRLRSALEPDREARGPSGLLVTRDHGYSLEVEPSSVDAVRAERLIEAARARLKDAPDRAATELTQALDLWRGESLEGLADYEFARQTAATLEELRAGAAEDRFDALLRVGAHQRILGELESFQRQHPLRERPVALLMLAEYRSGRHAEALRAFERFRKHLDDELGLVPSPELRRLEEQVLLHDERLQAPAGSAVVPRSVAANPFKGLRPFDEADQASFFGRERLVAEVVRKIGAGERLVTIVGPSGSGKSSLLGAGVVAALRKGAVSGSEDWTIARMVPAAHPFAELEAALLSARLDGPESLGELLDDEELGVLRASLRMVTPESNRLVIVIDQLEELFTATEPARAERFLSSLVHVVDDPRGRVVVVAAIRADFYGRLLAHGPFATRMASGIVNVVPLQPDELERAMQAPLEQATVGFDRALMATLVGDVLGRPAALPLFQYTLTELFDRRPGDILTLDDYRAIGGVSGVVGTTADRLYEAMGAGQRTALRALLLRLVTVGEGGQRTRRRVDATELLTLDLDPADLQYVVEVFGRQRLLSFDRSTTGVPTVEVAHEALLAEWARLSAWIDEAEDDIRRRGMLDLAIAEWRDAGEDPEFLPTGGRLAEYERWATTSTVELDDGERGFIRRAIARRDDHDHDEAERDRRLAALDRRAKRRTGALVAIVVLLLLGVVGFVVARQLRESPTSVAVIAYGANGDNSIADQLANGVAQAERLDGVDLQALRPLSDMVGEIRALLDAGPDLAIFDGVLVMDNGIDIAALAEAYPDTRLVTLDVPQLAPDGANVTALEFSAEEGSFLAGAAAALTTTTGTIGFVGGHPGIVGKFEAGYTAGARAVDADIDVLSVYPVSSTPRAVFGEPDVVGAAARDLYQRGADVVYHAAGGAGRAVTEAAAEESDRIGRKLWSIGVDVDEWSVVDASIRDHLLTSMVKRHDLAIPEVIRRFRAGTLPTGEFRFTLADGAMDLSRSGGFLSEANRQEIERLRTAVADGSIVVPEFPRSGPTVVSPADVTLSLTYVEPGGCESFGATARRGDIVRLDVTNRTASPLSVAVMALAGNPGGSSVDLEGSFPYTFVDVRAGGTQVLTMRMNPGRFALTCTVGEETTVGSTLYVGGALLAFPTPTGWSAPYPSGDLFYFEPFPDSTDAIYLMLDPYEDLLSGECQIVDGPRVSGPEMVAWLHTLPGVQVTDQPPTEIDGHTALVVDVEDRRAESGQCVGLDQVPLFFDRERHATQIREGEAARFLLLDLPDSRTALIGIHASSPERLPALVEEVEGFLSEVRFNL